MERIAPQMQRSFIYSSCYAAVGGISLAQRAARGAVAYGTLHPDRALAFGDPQVLSQLRGEAIQDPVEGLDGVWLHRTDAALARQPPASNAIVVDPLTVLTSALDRVVRTHAAALLGRQEVLLLLDNLKQTQPAAVKGVVPEMASWAWSNVCYSTWEASEFRCATWRL
jgi:flagellar biosynthesis component FlhA